MLNEIDSIIVCGGTGKRMGKLARTHGCKSLVPVLGIPAVSYLVESIRSTLPNSKLIFAIDNPTLRSSFEKILKKRDEKNYLIYE